MLSWKMSRSALGPEETLGVLHTERVVCSPLPCVCGDSIGIFISSQDFHLVVFNPRHSKTLFGYVRRVRIKV